MSIIYLLTIIVFAFFSIYSFFVQNGGIIQYEPLIRIPFYLDNRSILKKIFDVNKNELFGWYQARELSYIFDIIDAYFIKISSFFHQPHFFSITYFICYFLIVFLVFKIGLKYIKHRSLSMLTILVLIFSSTPIIFLNVNVFRSAKILTGLFLLVIIGLILKIKESKFKRSHFFLLFLTTFFLTLVDRQGFYFAVVISFLTFLYYIYSKNKLFLNYFICIFTGVVTNTFYNLYIGPLLIKSINGYWPSFFYQKMQDSNPIQTKVLIDSLFFTVDAISYFFGNNRLLALFCFGFLLVYYIKTEAVIKNKLIKLIFILVILASIYVLNVIMISRHPFILWPEVRISYYVIPIMVLILLFAIYVTNKIILNYPKTEKLLTVFLLIIFILNVFSLPKYYKLMRFTNESDVYRQWSPSLISCIKLDKYPIDKFNLPAEIKKFCQVLRPN